MRPQPSPDHGTNSGLRPGIGATAVFTAGFLVMLFWWLIAYRDVELPAFPDYYSGTLGDAIFLPGLLYGLLAARASLPRTTKRLHRALAVTFAIIGGILGAVTQLAWLADPNARLNWMLIDTARFSAVGWYHAAFLIATSAWIGYLLADVLVRLRVASESGRQELKDVARLRISSLGCALTILAGLLFASTVALDSAPSLDTVASRATVLPVAAGLFVATAVAVATLRDSALLLLPPIAAATLGAGAAITAIVSAPQAPGAYGLLWFAAAAFAGAGHAFASYRGEAILLSDRLHLCDDTRAVRISVRRGDFTAGADVVHGRGPDAAPNDCALHHRESEARLDTSSVRVNPSCGRTPLHMDNIRGIRSD